MTLDDAKPGERIAAACPVCGDELRTRDFGSALQWLTLWHRHSAVEHAAALHIRSVEGNPS